MCEHSKGAAHISYLLFTPLLQVSHTYPPFIMLSYPEHITLYIKVTHAKVSNNFQILNIILHN